MLVNHTFYTTLTIILSVVVLLGITYLWKKKFETYVGAAIGIALSGLVFGALNMSAGKLYVIDTNLHAKAHRVLGTYHLTLRTGEPLDINIPFNRVGVLNQSQESLALDPIEYGPEGYVSFHPSGKERIWVGSGDYIEVAVPKNTIDFFWGTEVPESIESYSYGREIKYWLHQAE